MQILHLLTQSINLDCHPSWHANEGTVHLSSCQMCCCCGGVLRFCSGVEGMDSQPSKKAFQAMC